MLYQKHIKDLIGHISRNHQELDSLINTGKLALNFLPKQAGKDKMLKNYTKKGS